MTGPRNHQWIRRRLRGVEACRPVLCVGTRGAQEGQQSSRGCPVLSVSALKQSLQSKGKNNQAPHEKSISRMVNGLCLKALGPHTPLKNRPGGPDPTARPPHPLTKGPKNGCRIPAALPVKAPKEADHHQQRNREVDPRFARRLRGLGSVVKVQDVCRSSALPRSPRNFYGAHSCAGLGYVKRGRGYVRSEVSVRSLVIV